MQGASGAYNAELLVMPLNELGRTMAGNMTGSLQMFASDRGQLREVMEFYRGVKKMVQDDVSKQIAGLQILA